MRNDLEHGHSHGKYRTGSLRHVFLQSTRLLPDITGRGGTGGGDPILDKAVVSDGRGGGFGSSQTARSQAARWGLCLLCLQHTRLSTILLINWGFLAACERPATVVNSKDQHWEISILAEHSTLVCAAGLTICTSTNIWSQIVADLLPNGLQGETWYCGGMQGSSGGHLRTFAPIERYLLQGFLSPIQAQPSSAKCAVS